MALSSRWRTFLICEGMAVVIAFAAGRALGRGAVPPTELSPASDTGPHAPDRLTAEPTDEPVSTCDPGVLEAALERVEELQAALHRPERRLEAIFDEHPDLNTEIPTYAAEDDPTLYEPERIRANMEELYRACGRADDWLGFDCSTGICRVVALRNEARWNDCEAYAHWEELYSRWSTTHGFTLKCEGGRSLPVVLWGPSGQPGQEPSPGTPDCEGLDAAACERAIEDYWEEMTERSEASTLEDEALARRIGCGHDG